MGPLVIAFVSPDFRNINAPIFYSNNGEIHNNYYKKNKPTWVKNEEDTMLNIITKRACTEQLRFITYCYFKNFPEKIVDDQVREDFINNMTFRKITAMRQRSNKYLLKLGEVSFKLVDGKYCHEYRAFLDVKQMFKTIYKKKRHYQVFEDELKRYEAAEAGKALLESEGSYVQMTIEDFIITN